MHLGAASELSVIEVELLIGLGGFTAYQTLINSECYDICPGVRAWVLRSMSERGKNPDYPLRSQNLYAKFIKRGVQLH